MSPGSRRSSCSGLPRVIAEMVVEASPNRVDRTPRSGYFFDPVSVESRAKTPDLCVHARDVVVDRVTRVRGHFVMDLLDLLSLRRDLLMYPALQRPDDRDSKEDPDRCQSPREGSGVDQEISQLPNGHRSHSRARRLY